MADIVLITPRFEASYWGMEHALQLFAKLGKRANMPVSALPLLAALTPAEHKICQTDRFAERVVRHISRHVDSRAPVLSPSSQFAGGTLPAMFPALWFFGRAPGVDQSGLIAATIFSAKSFQHLRVFLRAGVRPQLHALPARKDVEMQMEHDLAAGGLVVLKDRYPVRRERRLDGKRDFLHARDELARASRDRRRGYCAQGDLGSTSTWPSARGMMSMKASATSSS